ncbi:unnamed protein product [Orchesella dallaii]|uniref:Uncharacterized protein n=1 Tax=Orchesella dallaii TaxID=48710 RepID=A0ABP1PPD1_9HEXA
MLMADEMSSSAWVLMDEDCDCGGPPPMFNLPPPPIPPNLPCELEMTCPSILSISDAEFKKIGSFPTVTFLVSSILGSCVILLVIAGLVWKYFKLRKKRKGVTQTKDFDHGPSMMNGNGVLYEDLAHARPRPPIAPPSIEMLDINHHPLASDGIMGNSKLDFSYFLNPPPIYEELPDHSDRNNGPSEDEFAEDELSVIDVPVGHDVDTTAALQARYHNATAGRGAKPRAQSLTRKRGSTRNGSGSNNGSAFKSQRSLDRRGRNGTAGSSGNPGKYNTAANPRAFARHNTMGGDNNNPGSMLILSNQNGMTMKIPPHLLAVLTESAMCNGGGARPYEIIPTSMGGHVTLTGANPGLLPNGVLVNHGGGMINTSTGIYPSSRSSGSSYGDGSSSASSARNNQQGKSIESSSFDSGIGPNFITSFINSPAYDQSILPPAYSLNTYEYAGAGDGVNNGGVINPAQYLQGQQHPSFRRLRMTPADREHPLYSNHLLT